MTPQPVPEGRPHDPAGRTPDGVTPSASAPVALPRQQRGERRAATLVPVAHGDPLEHPDPQRAADAAAVENLLRCWVRENDLPRPAAPSPAAPPLLRIPLDASGTALLVPVHHWSPSGWHRFGPPVLEGGPHDAPPADAVTVAALLGREAVRAAGSEPIPHGAEGGAGHRPVWGDGGELVGRVADSVRRTAVFLDVRRRHPDGAATNGAGRAATEATNGAGRAATEATPGAGRTAADTGPSDLFLTAEQALLLGHPLHPAPKSREGLSEDEARHWSPESRGAFPLHWLAVAPAALAADSAWTESGRTLAAEQLTARLAGPGLPLPPGHAALPLHPWQARQLVHRPEAAALLDAGLVQDLGAHGDPWRPTSSVRTVYRTGAPAMLKLSLGLRITNSRRENLRKELHRGVEVHRLLRAGLAARWHAAHPGFDIVRDPAWLAVDGPDGSPVPGLDVMIRHNPFTPGDDVNCVAGLVSPRPVPAPADGSGRAPLRSRLAELVSRLAVRTGRPAGAVAAEWFLRYLEHVVRPVLWLDGEAGIALEAHQQNTLVLLDRDGWPTGGRYRDNQGYYFRASHRDRLDARLPGIGRHSDTFVPDEVTDERFAYYLAVNNVLGLIGAFGSQRLADEHLLVAAFRSFLRDAATAARGTPRSPLPARLLESPTLRCKANLLTRLHGLDELVGPVDTQSVYVTIANPLHA